MRPIYLLLIAITAIAVSLEYFNRAHDRETFQGRLALAQGALEETIVGSQVMKKMAAYGLYQEPVKVIHLSKDEMLRMNRATGGSIRLGDSERFEILVNQNLSQHELAHTLTHELQHIEDYTQSDSLLKKFPDLKSSLDETAARLHAQDRVQELLQTNHAEVSFVLQSLFCAELRAHRKNFELEKEGIPFENMKIKSQGLLTYISETYIHKFGIRMEPGTQEQITEECLASRSFDEYQDKALRRMFPRIVSHRQSERLPQSI